MNEKFGWCFIGCGTLAKTVAKQITESGRHKIVSVYSRNPERADRFAGQYGAAACGSAEDAIMTEGVEGVYVVTTHDSHYAYTKLALNLGKPVLCEKPFTVTAAQAQELVALAKTKQLYLAEAMWTWFAPVANRVKSWLDNGEFGQIQKVVVNCHLNSKDYAPRMTDPNAAGGALLDMGVYPVTYLYRLFGKPEKIKCRGVISGGIDWEEDIDFQFPSGECYSTSVSIHDTNGGQRIIIEGTKARTEIPDFHYVAEAELVRNDGTADRVSGRSDYLNEFDLVAAEITEGLRESRFVPFQATLDVMEIMDECRAQLNLKYPFEK
ncbi:MAG: Gfo/Idh/MocA family oxidoreductase [bacterium]|nr:Gfo/Idh/MocA family oxidoreductase [bacterium]